MTGKIGVVGDLCVDIIIYGLPRMPEWSQEIEVKNTVMRLGGNIGNMAVGASILKTDFSLMAMIADDDEGKFILNRLSELQIDTGGVRFRDETSTCKTYSCVRDSDGERFMLTCKGALNYVNELILTSDPIACDVIFIGGWCLPPRVDTDKVIERISTWKKEDKIVSCDLIWSDETWTHKEELVKLIKNIDVLFMNEAEFKKLTETQDMANGLQTLAAMLELGKENANKVCVIKMGSLGAMLLTASGVYYADAYPVTPIDTVGAGDVFNIGFLHAMFQGGYAPTDALRFGTTFASLCVSQYGKSVPTMESIQACMKTIEVRKLDCGVCVTQQSVATQCIKDN